MSVIGYAQSNFETLRLDKNVYIDRTGYIRTLENQSNKNVIFVRPRRFGKSLWLSMLHYYYGVEHKDKFDTLFGELEIGKNPTPLRNSYLILTMQFAGIDVETDDSTYQGFRRNVMTGIIDCMNVYSDYFSQEEVAEVKALDTPASMLQLFFSLYKNKKIPHKLYMLTDEYDQFANELVSFDTDRFRAIIGRSGYVRKYYEMIKNATYEGVVNRFFATGVSPLTVDALTSGFNITSSLGIELEFHNLMGFTHAEVVAILKQVGAKDKDMPSIMKELKEWYNGYLFHEDAADRLYNSDMVMYFAAHYEKSQKFPRRMLDANIATDYSKVKKIFNIQQREEEFIPILKKLTTEGELFAQITDFFNLELDFTNDDIISLLYYMGWLTIQDEVDGIWRFKMPNRVISELYYDYFVSIGEREAGLNNIILKIRDALDKLSKNNNPHPFLEIIKALIDKDLSLRDAQRFDEKHLKMLLIPYFSLSAAHYVKSEPEWGNMYPDLLLLKRPSINTRYNFIIELKYIKLSDKDKMVKTAEGGEERLTDKIAREARTQLAKYLTTDNAKRLENLKAWVLILVGREWQLVEEIPVD
jgi:hypothetical protein